jgi:DnaJ-class molecular chaperone
MKKSGTKRNPFSDDYMPYGQNTGPKGNPDQWKRAFDERFSADQAQKILGEETINSSGEWAILEVAKDSPWSIVKKAYRKLAMECQAAFGLNPDPVVEEKFKRIKAAYSLIADRLGEKS